MQKIKLYEIELMPTLFVVNRKNAIPFFDNYLSSAVSVAAATSRLDSQEKPILIVTPDA